RGAGTRVNEVDHVRAALVKHAPARRFQLSRAVEDIVGQPVTFTKSARRGESLFSSRSQAGLFGGVTSRFLLESCNHGDENHWRHSRSVSALQTEGTPEAYRSARRRL